MLVARKNPQVSPYYSYLPSRTPESPYPAIHGIGDFDPADPTRPAYRYGPPIHDIFSVPQHNPGGGGMWDPAGYDLGQVALVDPARVTIRRARGIYEPVGYDLGLPGSISSFLPYQGFGELGLPWSVPTFLAKIAGGSTISETLAGISTIASIVGAIPGVPADVVNAVSVVTSILSALEVAAQTGAVPKQLCGYLADPGERALFSLLNSSRGIWGGQYLGDAADVIAIAGAMCGDSFYAAAGTYAETVAWLKTRSIRGAAVQPPPFTGKFPAGTISRYDASIQMWRNFATPSAIATWKPTVGLHGLGAVAAPSGTQELPPPYSPTAAPASPPSAGMPTWAWVLIAAGGVVVLGGGGYLLLRRPAPRYQRRA